jgi:hypothetical protein
MIGKERIQAEILDREVERMQAGENPAAPADIQPLLETARRVKDLLTPPAPAAHFIQSAQFRLLRRIRQSAEPERIRSLAGKTTGRGWLRLSPVYVAIAVLVVLVSGLGVTSASAKALPGDALYPAKRGLEEVSLAFSFSPAGDVKLLAEFAGKRIEEIQELARQGREADLAVGLKEYAKILGRLESALVANSSIIQPAQWEDIQTQLDHHAQDLRDLKEQLPQQAQGTVDHAVDQSQKSIDRIEEIKNNQVPSAEPTSKENNSTQEPGRSGEVPSTTPVPSEPSPASGISDTSIPTDTPELTNTPEPTDSPKPSDTPEINKPSKTPKPSKTQKIKTPEPATIEEPSATPVNTPTPAAIVPPSSTSIPTKGIAATPLPAAL